MGRKTWGMEELNREELFALRAADVLDDCEREAVAGKIDAYNRRISELCMFFIRAKEREALFKLVLLKWLMRLEKGAGSRRGSTVFCLGFVLAWMLLRPTLR
jgi:hypothetical protein